MTNNKDFSKYQKLINQFRGQVKSSGFSSKFSVATKNLPKTEMFLLKMELNRLASPCTRLVDLRGLVDGECRLFEYEGKIHFLDEVATRVFQENIAIYGEYTFGVYEAVKNTENNFRVIYKNNQNQSKAIEKSPISDNKSLEKSQYPASLFLTGRYYDRCEERMNFVITLSITLADNQQFEVSTSDISVEGCKFRLVNAPLVQIEQCIKVRFTGLEDEFQFDKHSYFEYKIKNIFVDGRTQVVGCQRFYAEESERNDSFTQFLAGYIQGNKRRYKINLDNTISALQSRTYEQYALPKLSELPVFLESRNIIKAPTESQSEQVDYIPRYALTSNNNSSISQYWQDEAHNSTLHYLINTTRIERIQKAMRLGRKLLVYSFVHQHQGKFFFYSADEQELKQDNEFKKQFLAFAASKPSFAITELTCLPVDASNAFAPFTLSTSILVKDRYLNAKPSDDVVESLTKLPLIVVVADITTPEAITDYQQLANEIDKNKLKVFGHKRTANVVDVDDLGVSYKNQRQESRFKYRTPAIVQHELVKRTGMSHDFSISGLKIELDEESQWEKGDIVKLTFPNLQKITSAFDLKELPYEVVRINKKRTVINLRVFVKKHQHIGRSFFKLLIKKNKSKLTPDEYAMLIPGLGQALRNIYASSLQIPSLLMQTSGSRYKTEVITSSDESGNFLVSLRELSDRPKFYNLYPFLSNLTIADFFNNSLKKMSVDDSPITEQLFIAITAADENVRSRVSTKFSSELNTPELRRFFIRNALKRGTFYCIQVKISRANKPDMGYLNPELNYIGSYAIHRGKQIEQDIWSVVGIIQCFDITQEVVFRDKLLN